MAKRDYYEVLGVSKGASEAEIKKAYRRLARKLHPDVNPGDKTSQKRFQEIQEAYDVLKDTEKRRAYDRFGHAASSPGFDAEAAAGFGGPRPFGGGGGAARGGFRQPQPVRRGRRRWLAVRKRLVRVDRLLRSLRQHLRRRGAADRAGA